MTTAVEKTRNGWQKVLSGKSVEGREIELFVTPGDVVSDVDTLLMAAFHGDERESEILVQAFINQYRPTDIVEEKRVAIIPVVNPDGLFRNQRMNARGVDLNRNFPTQDWAELNPDTIYYSGTAAASEPETQFVLQVLETCSPRKIITVHTPYKVINFDGPAEGLAQAMAVPTGYPVVADIGYSTPGSFGTYVGKERNIPTITLELPEEGFDEEALARNLDSLMAGIAYPV